MDRDLKFKKEGDVEIKNGDIALATQRETIEQHILNRIKSNDPEWFFHPYIASNLEDLRGLPNSQDTGDMCEQYIKNSLNYGSFFNPGDFDIDVVPTGVNTIISFITTNKNNQEVKISHEVEL